MKKTKTYSFENARSGGVSQRDILSALRAANITARPAATIYEGHSAVAVDGGARVQSRAARIIFRGQ